MEKKGLKNRKIKRHLSLITYKDIMLHCNVSAHKAQDMITHMRTTYKKKQLTLLHLYHYLGISKLKVICKIVFAG